MSQNNKEKPDGKKNSAPESSDDDQDYKFQLIQFNHSQSIGILDIDVVPSFWISWDKVKKSCIIKYPSPPYTFKVCKKLQQLVQNEEPPPDHWEWWDVTIKGGADSYEVALERLEKLRTEAFAYSTDGLTDAQVKSQKATKKVEKSATMPIDVFDVADIEVINDDWTINSKDQTKADRRRSLMSSSDESMNSQELIKPQRKKKHCQNSQQYRPSSVTNTIFDGNNNGHQNSRAGSMPPNKTKGKKAMETNESRIQSIRDKKHEKNHNSSPQTKLSLAKPATTRVLKTDEVFNATDIHAEVPNAAHKLSPDTLFLLKIMKRFSNDLQANTDAINALHNQLSEKLMISPKGMTVKAINENYELELPLNTREKFEEFDQRLRDDKAMNHNVMISLKQLLDRNNNVTKSITSIFRKFFTRDIATGFTAKKQVEGKILLKTTNFGRCLIGALTNFHTLTDGTPVNEAIILRSAGYAIANARDWDGRKPRPAGNNIS